MGWDQSNLAVYAVLSIFLEDTVMPEPTRCVLVVPTWCISPHTGGGQRTHIFFSALKRLGPTEVVVFGYNLQREAVERHFVGHAGLYLVDVELARAQRLVGLKLQLDRVRRYLMFWEFYQSVPAAQACVEERIRAGTKVFVYRYFQPFCWAVPASGAARSEQGARHYVDVDDRDDQKLQISMQDFLRSATLGRIYGGLMLPYLRRTMRRKLALARRVWLSAAEDRADLPGLPTTIIPNVPFETPSRPATLPSARRDLLFVGSGGYTPNRNGVRWFLQSCWPAIHARHPDSRFRVVGSGDWPSLAAEFRDTAGVDFVGRVDSVSDEYDRARFSIVPIFAGGGTKIKLIESCAFGLPAVSTVHSARGFGEQIESLVLQGDTPELFIANCLWLLGDDDEADSRGAKLRELQQAQFSRQAVEEEIADQIRISEGEVAENA